MRLTAGRWPRPGLHELAVGHWAASAIPGTSLGQRILVNAHMWSVVGVFESETALAGTFLADSEAILDEFGRDGYNAVVARLADDCNHAALQESLTARGLDVDVVKDVDYAARSVAALGTFRTLAAVVGIPMSLGAIFCVFGVASMAVQTRKRELGTLLAIGFSPSTVATALVLEFVLVGAMCATVACAMLTFAMSGELITIGVETTSLTFEWHSSTLVFLTALMASGVAALLGASVPAFRTSRLPVTRVLDVR